MERTQCLRQRLHKKQEILQVENSPALIESNQQLLSWRAQKD